LARKEGNRNINHIIPHTSTYFLSLPRSIVRMFELEGIKLPYHLQVYPDPETKTLFSVQAKKPEELKERHILNADDQYHLDEMKRELTRGVKELKRRRVRSANIEIELMTHIKKLLKP